MIKRTAETSLISYCHLSIYFLSFFSHAITQNSILSRKPIYKHENSMQFPCLYHIPHFPTAFSVKPIHLSAKTANILPLFTFPIHTITETPDFCVKVYFCLIVRFFPQSPPFQRHQKRKSEPPAKPNIINLRKNPKESVNRFLSLC